MDRVKAVKKVLTIKPLINTNQNNCDMKAITLNELLQGPANNPARKALYEFLFQKGYPADVIATCTSFELRWMAKR